MNRIKEIYEVANKFLALPSMARAIIGTHFKVLAINEFWNDEDKANEQIFCGIFKKDLLFELDSYLNLWSKANGQ